MKALLSAPRGFLFHTLISIALWALIIFSIVSVMSCGMQRAYTVNFDKNGNLTGGFSMSPVTCGSGCGVEANK